MWAGESVPVPTVDPTGGLLSYGVLGIVVVLLVTGLLVPGYLWKRTESENDRLRKLIDDKVYPLVAQAVGAVEECVALLKDMALAIHDLRAYAESIRELPNLIRELRETARIVREIQDELRRESR